MDYLRRLFNVIIFFFIWLGIPIGLSQLFDNSSHMLWAMITWLPAFSIAIYLDE
jgi:hypothetical protein